jgi:hypothetical protein
MEHAGAERQIEENREVEESLDKVMRDCPL